MQRDSWQRWPSKFQSRRRSRRGRIVGELRRGGGSIGSGGQSTGVAGSQAAEAGGQASGMDMGAGHAAVQPG